MKKLVRILLSATTAASLLVVPVVVHAQESDPIIIDTQDTSGTIPSTGAAETTPTTPDTGFAPPNNKLAQNVAVFAGGSLLGAGLGLGVLKVHKKQSEK